MRGVMGKFGPIALGPIALVRACLALAGCGGSRDMGDRAGGGALVGAGTGAAVGAIFGGIGALPGAARGFATTEQQVNLGPSVWERSYNQ